MTSARDEELPLGFLLKHAYLAYEARADAALASVDLNSRELGVLRVIVRNPGSSQLQVAERIGVDRTTMVGMLDTLERKGIIARKTDPSDRRRNVVELTKAGADSYGKALRIVQKTERQFLAGTDSASEAALRRVLVALHSRASTVTHRGDDRA